MVDLLNTSNKLEDIAYNWVLTVLPQEGSAYGAAFAQFSSTLAFLGSLLIAFHVVVGIVSSAHSGKVLGDRYHQIWAPLRVVLGFGMMIPLAGGFSAVHYMLRDVVGPAAVNLGNAPIVAYIDHLAENGGTINVASMQGDMLVQDILEREVCYAAWNGVHQNAGWASRNAPWATASQPPLAGSSGTLTNTYTWDYGVCGSFSYAEPAVSHPDGSSAAASINARIAEFHTERRNAVRDVVEAVRNKLDENVPTTDGTTGSGLGDYFATKSFTNATNAAVTTELITAGVVPSGLSEFSRTTAGTYNRRVALLASQVYSESDDDVKELMKKRIERFGFMAAGSYERELSRMSGISNALANATPTRTSPNLNSPYTEAVVGANNAFLAARSLEAPENAERGGAQMADGVGPIDTIVGWMFPNVDNMLAGTKSEDPIGDMISLGHWLLTISQTTFVTLMLVDAANSFGILGKAAATVAGTVGGGPVGTAIMATLSAVGPLIISFFTSIALIITIIGIVHAYVLPMLPMIMVFVMGVSWLILFLEASVAGVLWAFAFIRMDGQEFFDRNQSPGVTLVFNLFLRPALGMLAFIGGIILLPQLLNALNLIWQESYDAQAGNGGLLFIFKYLTGLVLFTYLQWHLTIRIFGLIPTIADRVGHWMGFGSSHGYNDGAESSAAVGALAAGAMTGMNTVNSASSAMRQAASGRRNAKAQEMMGQQTREMEQKRHDEILGALRGR